VNNFCLLSALFLACGDGPAAAVKVLTTPSGTRFGLVGDEGKAPAPTLLYFALDLETTLGHKDYNKIAKLLGQKGVLCVALDVPAHGQDRRRGEPQNGLEGWRARTEKGEDWVAPIAKQSKDVLDYLVKIGHTDPRRVAAAGTSRGGFIACHVAAVEPRIKAVVCFGPDTELMALREFDGTNKAEAVRALNVAHLASKLADRSLWVVIGNNDERVGTDRTIAFTRAVVRAAVAKKLSADVTLVVDSATGHSMHESAHDEAAVWVLGRLQAAK
jgi:dienelactone hydrolase